jgi:carbohydrate binding protein with CBM4/9 domain
MKLGIALLMGFAVPAALAGTPSVAQERLAADPVLINNANPASFQVYGVSPAPKSVADDSVEGGRALHVPVTGSGDAWAAGVNVPITKAIKKGDKIALYFWAKLEGTGSAKIAAAQLQLAGAPYTRIFGEGVTITPQWKLYQVSGTADAAYAKGTLNAAFHLNTGNHTVVLGAVAVLDQGQ